MYVCVGGDGERLRERERERERETNTDKALFLARLWRSSSTPCAAVRSCSSDTLGPSPKKRNLYGTLSGEFWTATSLNGKAESVTPPICRNVQVWDPLHKNKGTPKVGKDVIRSEVSRVIGSAAQFSQAYAQYISFNTGDCTGNLSSTNEVQITNYPKGTSLGNGRTIDFARLGDYCAADYAILHSQHKENTCATSSMVGAEKGVSSAPAWACQTYYSAELQKTLSVKHECTAYGKQVLKTVYSNSNCAAAGVMTTEFHPNKQCQYGSTALYDMYQCVQYGDPTCTTTTATTSTTTTLHVFEITFNLPYNMTNFTLLDTVVRAGLVGMGVTAAGSNSTMVITYRPGFASGSSDSFGPAFRIVATVTTDIQTANLIKNKTIALASLVTGNITTTTTTTTTTAGSAWATLSVLVLVPVGLVQLGFL